MGVVERREREKEQVRTRIVEAARDLLSEHGLAGLSMRAIAERIEYSPATIYLYFRDKDALVREVVRAGFVRMREYVEAEVGALPETARALDQYGAMGRAYVRFGLENTAYFRVMFELPGVAAMDCPEAVEGSGGERGELIEPDAFERAVDLLRRAREEGDIATPDARRAALIGWALVHGLTSLYLAGGLAQEIGGHEAFMELVEEAMVAIHGGWSAGAGREPAGRSRGRGRRGGRARRVRK
jgi:AcrR family transcriptional regulator